MILSELKNSCKVFFRWLRKVYFCRHQGNLRLNLLSRGCLPDQVDIGADGTVVVVEYVPADEDDAVKGDEEHPCA